MADPTTPTPSDGAIEMAEARAEFVAARALGADGKPGWKTTEFWTHLASQAAGAAIITYGMVKGIDVLIEVGALLTGGTQVGYALARTLAKRLPVAAPAAPAA